MQKISLSYLFHRGKDRIGIFFERDGALDVLVKKLPGLKWSRQYGCWYLDLTFDTYKQIGSLFAGKTIIVDATLSGLVQERANGSPGLIPERPGQALLSAGNREALRRFTETLKLRAYSASTIRTYENEFIQLLKVLKQTAVETLTTADLKRYMVYAMEKEGIKENTAHSRLNALKFYFEQVLGKDKFFWEIPRPKKAEQLPKVFSQDEVAAIINCTTNAKHKVMLMLAYSAGLRVSEVVSLKTYQVDSNRMTIFINAAKGKKDRQVTLSPVLLVMLRAYARVYQPDKRGYLFEGNRKGIAYSTRSLQEVLQAAKQKAGVMRPGSIHSLRHSFATHLVEKGTDISMIQKLLGHNDIKTTLIYLHTSNKDLLKIVSPLDDLHLT